VRVPLLCTALALLPLLTALLTSLALHTTGARRRTWQQLRAEARAHRAANGVLDVEVEVDADELQEVVADGDEPHFDGHLQVLEPPELIEQLTDFVVYLLGLPHDER